MEFKDINELIEEINNREQDEDGCITITEEEYLLMRKIDYTRPDDITMYIIKK